MKYVEEIKSDSARFLGGPILCFSFVNGEIVPHDQGGFIVTHEEWEKLRGELDGFFTSTKPEFIAQHNDALYDKHFGGSVLTVYDETTPRPPRFYDAKIRRRLIRERGLNCEECAEPQTRKTIEMHHVIAVIDGGTSEDANLRLLCRQCHLKYKIHRPRGKGSIL